MKNIFKSFLVLIACSACWAAAANATESIRPASSNLTSDSEEKLPDWYMSNRVHYHWECPAHQAEKKGAENWIRWFESVHDVIAESGAKVNVAAGRYGAEGAWWPTEVGDVFAPFSGRDVLKDSIIDDFKDLGLRTIVYYRHDIDYAMQEANPEWLARNADGSMVKKKRAAEVYGKQAYQMCQNSPFREYTKKRLMEIFERGADGVYFDEDHMPEVCFCDNCKKAFKEKYGRPMPKNPKPATEAYLTITRFVGQTLAETFSEWKAAVQQINPEAVLLVSASRYAQFTDLHQTEAMARSGSANKTEFQKCFGGQQHFRQAEPIRYLKEHPNAWLHPRDVGESLEWMINRDVFDGRPPHIWVASPAKDDPEEVLHTAAAVIAHGGIASMGISPLQKYVHNYRETFAMNDALAPFMKEARPYARALIHVSNELKESLYVEGGGEYAARLEHLYAPVTGAADVLTKAHIPFATVSDGLLKKKAFAPETEVLIVPSYGRLSTELKRAVDNSGLRVVKLEGDWHLKAAQPALRKAFYPQLGKPKIKVMAPKNLFATFMINDATGELLVSLVRDWHWFWFYSRKSGQIRSEEIAKQSAIESIKIHAPGTQNVLFPANDTVDAPIDICRFIKITPPDA